MKSLILKIFTKISRWKFLFLVLLPFALWVFCFRDFFTGRLWLEEDALSYADHIRFYIEYLSKGIFPLWDPTWVGGVPNHFFLQRIGEVNPLLFLMVLLKWLGVPLTLAYLIFLGMYYFLAMWAFYLIARFLLKDRFFAFVAYILLLFSSWGPEIFYNYIIIIFVPVIWFFYFLLCFAKEAKKGYFLGMCLCVGLIVTTYIPFFFLTILTIFTILYILFYNRLFLDFLKRFFQFCHSHKFLTTFCIIFLLASCIPALVFYQESKSGEFILPGRHAGASSSSAVAVGAENAASGDIISHGYFDRLFYDHTHIDMGDIFIPYLFFLILLCATFGPADKLIFFLLFNILALSLITITSAGGVYHFLYTHVLFFKFIRNIYYFFWLAMLPMGILLSVRAFKSLLAGIDACAQKTGWLICIIVCHAAFIGFLFRQGGVLIGAWAAVLIIFLYFLIYLVFEKKISRPAGFCLFLLAVFIQSVQVYGCLGDKLFRMQQALVRQQSIERSSKNIEAPQHVDLYYALRWFTVLINNIDLKPLGIYRQHPFILYDNVAPYVDSQESLKVLEKAMGANANMAYVSKFESHSSDWANNPDAPNVANVNPMASGQVSLWGSDPNSMKIKTHLKTRQFLVINDNYHSDWHAFINGRSVPLLRANVAFKGLWVPAGDAVVVLRFSNPLCYMWHGLLIAVFWGTFVYLLVLIKKEKMKFYA